MSTSFKKSERAEPIVHPYLYQDVSDSGVPRELPSNPADNNLGIQDHARREDVVYENGRQQGISETQSTSAARIEQAQHAVAQSLQTFEKERAAFYRKIESEVVSLALSIARKILHREAQVDPLPLAGMVRVVLDKFEAATRITVRVNPELFVQWSKCLTNSTRNLEVIEDAGVDRYGCVIETEVGKTELGLEVQIKEIEQGLMDLLNHIPVECK